MAVAAEQLPGEPAQPLVMPLEDLGERMPVARQDAGDELTVALHHEAHTYTTGTSDARQPRELPEGVRVALSWNGLRSGAGVLAHGVDSSLHEPAGGLGGDAEALADLTEALALPVEQPEPGLDGKASPRIERAEELVEQVAVDHRHHGIFGQGFHDR